MPHTTFCSSESSFFLALFSRKTNSTINDDPRSTRDFDDVADAKVEVTRDRICRVHARDDIKKFLRFEIFDFVRSQTTKPTRLQDVVRHVDHELRDAEKLDFGARGRVEHASRKTGDGRLKDDDRVLALATMEDVDEMFSETNVEFFRAANNSNDFFNGIVLARR